MTDKKISELTALAGADMQTTDQMVVARASTSQNFSMTRQEFLNSSDALLESSLESPSAVRALAGRSFATRAAAVTEWAAMVARSETPPVGTVWTWPNGSIVYDGSTDISDLSGWRLSSSRSTVAQVETGANIIAHRGFKGQYPENTLLAFSRALDVTPHIEFDLSVSSDGTIYSFHDQTIDALTDGTGTFTALSDAYIVARKFDALSGGYLHDYVRIPTLASILDMAVERAAFIWPELKNLRSDSDVNFILGEVSSHDLLGRCVFQSGTMSRVTSMLDYDRRVMAGFLTGSTDLSALQGQVDTLAEYPLRSFLMPGYSAILAEPTIVDYATNRGVGIATWTTNTGADFDSLIAAGVHNIITDYTIGGLR